jgi:hypothetical protein
MAVGKLDIHMQKVKLDSFLSPHKESTPDESKTQM